MSSILVVILGNNLIWQRVYVPFSESTFWLEISNGIRQCVTIKQADNINGFIFAVCKIPV